MLRTPPADSDRPPSRGRRVVGALAAVALVLGVVGASSLAYRRAYGTWWQTPDRISYCDRTYAASSVTAIAADPGGGRVPGRQLVARSRTSIAPCASSRPCPPCPIVGKPVLAVVAPALAREAEGLPCAMALYLQTGADSYVAFRHRGALSSSPPACGSAASILGAPTAP